jgi:outer membrane protein
MKTKSVITGAMVISGILHASAQDTTMYLSLKQSCQFGIEKNVNVQNAGLEQQKTNYQLREAQSKLYPQVEAYSNFNYYYSIPKMIIPGEIFGQTGLIAVEIGTKFDWSNGFKASQVLYNQSYFTSLKLARRLGTLSELNLQQKKEEIVYQVSQLYFLCQTTGKQIGQLKTTMKNTERLLEIAKLQNENGLIRKVDYSRVSVNKDNLQTQIDNLNQLYYQQLGLLKYLIGIEVTANVELSDSLTFTLTDISSPLPDNNNRTEIKLLNGQIETTSLTHKINQQSYIPTLAGFAQYYYQGQRNSFDFLNGGTDKFYKVGFVGLSLNIPIFDGFEKHSKIRQNEIELLQLKNTLRSSSTYFSKEFSDAVKQYKNNMNIILRQQENIRVAEDTYNLSLQSYNQHVVPLSDLLMSESSLVEARLSYYNALMQLKNAELDVKKAKGELLNY